MTPAERAVIEAARALVADLDDVDATRTLIDACSVLDALEPATFTDVEGDVWTLRENGLYSITGPIGFATLEHVREYYGRQS